MQACAWGATDSASSSREGAHQKIPHVGRCIVEDDVEIGANTTIDRGSIDDTVIGAGTKIDNLVMIAHNVRVGRLCLIVAQAGIAGSARIGDGCVIGGQAGIQGHAQIGARARLARRLGCWATYRRARPGRGIQRARTVSRCARRPRSSSSASCCDGSRSSSETTTRERNVIRIVFASSDGGECGLARGRGSAPRGVVPPDVSAGAERERGAVRPYRSRWAPGDARARVDRRGVRATDADR